MGGSQLYFTEDSFKTSPLGMQVIQEFLEENHEEEEEGEKKKVGEKHQQHLRAYEQSCKDLPRQPSEHTLGNKRSVSFHTQVLG